MFALVIVVWTIIIASVVSRYPRFFRKVTSYRLDFNSSDSDSEPDDNMVGHSSLSETEEMENRRDSDSDSDSEFDPDDEETEKKAAKILMSFKKYKNLPDYMKDFYDEAEFPKDWLTLTDEEKKAKLDEDLAKYLSKE